MEQTIAVIVFVTLVLITLLIPVVMRRPNLKMRFEAMDDRRLVQLQVQYRMLRRNMRIGAYLIPLPLLLVSLVSHQRALMNGIFGFIFLVSCSLLLAARILGEIERLATTEIEFRKVKRDSAR